MKTFTGSTSVDYSAKLAWDEDLNSLQGHLLTFIEATTDDPEKRKASKDIVRAILNDWRNKLPNLKSEGLDSPNFTLINK